MYPGKLIKIVFKFLGSSSDAVLDRFLTERLIGEYGDKSIVKSEVYGEKGAVIWLLSQMEYVEVLKPDGLRENMKKSIKKC